jgi:hypothetical protein
VLSSSLENAKSVTRETRRSSPIPCLALPCLALPSLAWPNLAKPSQTLPGQTLRRIDHCREDVQVGIIFTEPRVGSKTLASSSSNCHGAKSVWSMEKFELLLSLITSNRIMVTCKNFGSESCSLCASRVTTAKNGLRKSAVFLIVVVPMAILPIRVIRSTARGKVQNKPLRPALGVAACAI